jgi:hypothetical protein
LGSGASTACRSCDEEDLVGRAHCDGFLERVFAAGYPAIKLGASDLK